MKTFRKRLVGPSRDTDKTHKTLSNTRDGNTVTSVTRD